MRSWWPSPKSTISSSSTTTPTATSSLTARRAAACSDTTPAPWTWASSSSACPRASTSPARGSASWWAGPTWWRPSAGCGARSTLVCSLPIQQAAIAALTGPLDMVKEQCGVYQQRRDALCGGLRSIGWDVPDSHGSMFVWAPIPAKYASSNGFLHGPCGKERRAVHPRFQLRPCGRRLRRFALTMPAERIAQAVQAIADSGILN